MGEETPEFANTHQEGYTYEEPEEVLNPATEGDETSTNQDLERFADLPNRREALQAKDSKNLTVFLSHAIAKKLYRCSYCSNDIAIGSEHVVMSRVQAAKKYAHNHIDFDCAHKKALPTLTAIQVVSPQEASASAINKRARKYRSKRRR